MMLSSGPLRVGMRLIDPVVLAALAVLLIASAPSVLLRAPLQGVSLDLLYLLRETWYGPRAVPQGPNAVPRVVVIGVDEETYRREPFAGTPQAIWTPYLGQVLQAVHAGGARVVGIDLIYPTSVDSLVPGFERPFLLALRRAGREGRLVLSKVQHQEHPLVPFAGQQLAVGGGANIRSVNLIEDADGVLRRAPLTFETATPDGAERRREPGLAVELALRSLGGPALTQTPEGTWLGDRLIAGPAQETLLINFATAPDALPVYSFADLFACAAAGNTDYFARHFQDTVVLIGTVLDVEDRRLTSSRWATAPEGQYYAERCQHPVMEGLYVKDRRRDTIPGVFIHAQAVNNLLRGDALTDLTPTASGAVVLGLAALAAVITFLASPLPAGIGVVALLMAWVGLALHTFHASGLVLPLLPAGLAAVLVFPALAGVRFIVVDADKRRLRQMFKLYLPDKLINQMLAEGGPPRLGGESRDISVMFSDIAGYTKMSEGLEPERLVEILNRFFTVMTDIIEDHGGFVDKYVGDAIIAVFGTPYTALNHARQAVTAALEMQAAMAANEDLLRADNGVRASCRIGIASGTALVGNIGSPRRFNYTVMGDTVNVASRIEGANKAYGTRIMVTESTVASYADPTMFRDLDRLRVVGRQEPLHVFEPIAPEALTDPTARADRATYDAALTAWRAGDFARAADGFASIAGRDPAAKAMSARVERQRARTPVAPAGWQAVTVLDEK